MLVAASLGLETRLITELTVYMPTRPDPELAYAVRPSEGRGYDSRASNFGLSSWTSILEKMFQHQWGEPPRTPHKCYGIIEVEFSIG